jgi:hypothetical protein
MNMKKAILNMLMLFAVTGVATAQTVTVADVEALPGETVKATLELTAPADTYSGVQFSIQFPATGFTNVLKAAGTNFETCQVGAMTDGKVKIAAANGETFESAIIEVEFDVDGSLPLDEYDVTVTDIQFEATGVEDHIADVPFKVIVTDRITLDENSTELPIARTGVNVKVKRTIKKDEWSTLCLPFDMDETQLKNIFGEYAQLAYFESYTTTKENSEVTGIEMNFTKSDLSDGFFANYPYLIKATKDVTEFNVDDVTVDPNEEETKAEYTVKQGPKYVVYGTFKGTYHANTTVPENSLFLSGNQLWYSTGKTKMKAFRAYFTLQDILTDKSVGARINITDDETTGIKEVHGNTNVEGTYDLQGRKVEKPANKGLYIVNGHKVVKK